MWSWGRERERKEELKKEEEKQGVKVLVRDCQGKDVNFHCTLVSTNNRGELWLHWKECVIAIFGPKRWHSWEIVIPVELREAKPEEQAVAGEAKP